MREAITNYKLSNSILVLRWPSLFTQSSISTHFLSKMSKAQELWGFLCRVKYLGLGGLFKSVTRNLSNSNSDASLSKHHLVPAFWVVFKGKVKYTVSNTQSL